MSRGKIKETIRDLSRRVPSASDKDEIIKLLVSQPPALVAAILGQTLVEAYIDRLLRAMLTRRDDKTWQDMVGENGPLKTFFSKSVLAYGLALIDEDQKANVNVVRNIRNAFAHSRHVLTFRNELIIRELKSAKIPKNLPAAEQEQLRNVIAAAEEDPQLSYVGLCFIIVSQVQDAHISHLEGQLARLKIEPETQGPLQQSSQDHQTDGPLPQGSAPDETTDAEKP